MSTYFSEQRGLRKGYSLPELRIIVRDLYRDLVEKEHLKEWIGYDCIDAGEVHGTAGSEPARSIVFEVGRTDIWPPNPAEGMWSEDAIFDFLQFIGQKVSSTVVGTGSFHNWDGCGLHGQDFEPEPAREQYVTRVNKILERYDDGWEMKPDFEIVERPPIGTSTLLRVQLPSATGAETRKRILNAVAKFRQRSSSRDDRREAVRNLGDVLEWLRKDAKNYLTTKDESDLFNILNNFDIRHNNERQKSDYDPIWLSGLFYHYLTMIHVLTHLIDRHEKLKASNEEPVTSAQPVG